MNTIGATPYCCRLNVASRVITPAQDNAIVNCFHVTIAYGEDGKFHVFENIDEIDRLEKQSLYPDIQE